MTSAGPETRRAGIGVGEHRAWSIASVALLAGITVLHVAMGLNASGHADMLRDIYWAQQIATGAAFPLAGPPIFDTISLGPWWYYLLAIPLWAAGSVVAVPVTTLVLASAKYWLAWWWAGGSAVPRSDCCSPCRCSIAAGRRSRSGSRRTPRWRRRPYSCSA
jgi:hypothetical protein